MPGRPPACKVVAELGTQTRDTPLLEVSMLDMHRLMGPFVIEKNIFMRGF